MAGLKERFSGLFGKKKQSSADDENRVLERTKEAERPFVAAEIQKAEEREREDAMQKHMEEFARYEAEQKKNHITQAEIARRLEEHVQTIREIKPTTQPRKRDELDEILERAQEYVRQDKNHQSVDAQRQRRVPSRDDRER